MKVAKEIAFAGIFTALLVGAQFVLSWISGVEVVTVLLLGYSYCFGVKRGLLVANAFSLLRCLIFGFFPNIFILYLIYYNLFVTVFGLLGFKFKRELNVRIHVLIIVTACIMTAAFTGLDDIVTPVYYKFSAEAAKAYALTSVTALVPQVVCTAITVTFLLPVLTRAMTSAANGRQHS